MMTETKKILKRLKGLGSRRNRLGMARFGIETKGALGISIPVLRRIAKELGQNHRLALDLWTQPVHEAKLLAIFIENPFSVTEKQMDAWARDFDSWDICDQCCGFLFDRTPFARKKALQWSKHRKEFVKRAGFALMAALAVHDKEADDRVFEQFLRCVRDESSDERNYVRKGVNWALRQIGKRNVRLHTKAIAAANGISGMSSPAARWIASDALRELTKKRIQERIRLKPHAPR